MSSTLVTLLLRLYYPFLALLCGGMLLLSLVCAALAVIFRLWLLFVPAVILLVALGHFLWPVYLVLTAKRKKDWMELKLPRKQLRGLYDLAEEVAADCQLTPPDEIRLAADSVAHVYEDERGKNVLVLGGVAVAAFSRPTLAGIIAHELAHFTAGDTSLSRQAAQRGRLMGALEWQFARFKGNYANPLVWGLLLYHLLFRLAWAAASREQEFAADRYAVEHAGEKRVATALVYLHATDFLPQARLQSLVETFVATNQPPTGLFAEQARLVREANRRSWEDACRKALGRGTGLFDDHPSLTERLKAVGVSPKRALGLALEQSGEPARDLVAGWEHIELELSERLMLPYREYFLAKMEVAQILMGRARY
jgi:Zn-dependent protease with chaperone function